MLCSLLLRRRPAWAVSSSATRSRAISPDTEVLILTGYADLQSAVADSPRDLRLPGAGP